MNEFSLSKRKAMIFPEEVEDEFGKMHPVRFGHQTILKILRLIIDEDIAEHHRIAKACDLFFVDDPSIPNGFELMLKFINHGELPDEGNGDEQPKRSSSGKVMDYEVDASEIYASFLQQYDIDLVETDVHWYRFGVLMASLLRTKDNPFSAKVHLRTMDTSGLKGKAKRNAEAAKQSVQIQTKVSAYDQMMEDKLIDAIQNGGNLAEILKEWK